MLQQVRENTVKTGKIESTGKETEYIKNQIQILEL